VTNDVLSTLKHLNEEKTNDTNGLWTPEMYVKVPTSEQLNVEMLLGYHFGSELLNNVDNGTVCKKCSDKKEKNEDSEDSEEDILEKNISSSDEESSEKEKLHFMTKTVRLYLPPPNLAITLKRFRYKNNGKKSTLEKINQHVKFPFTLDLTPYTLRKLTQLIKRTRESQREVCIRA